jgi:hypothetical protein
MHVGRVAFGLNAGENDTKTENLVQKRNGSPTTPHRSNTPTSCYLEHGSANAASIHAMITVAVALRFASDRCPCNVFEQSELSTLQSLCRPIFQASFAHWDFRTSATLST